MRLLDIPLVADNLLEAVSHAIVVVGAGALASLQLPVLILIVSAAQEVYHVYKKLTLLSSRRPEGT